MRAQSSIAILLAAACGADGASPSANDTDLADSSTSHDTVEPSTTTSVSSSTTTDVPDGTSSSESADDSTTSDTASDCTSEIIAELTAICPSAELAGRGAHGVLAWYATDGGYVQRLHADGTLDGDPIALGGQTSVVAMDVAADGSAGIVVDGASQSLEFGVLRAGDTTLATTAFASPIDLEYTSIASGNAGWAATWRHRLYEPDQHVVVDVARFDADGVGLGASQQIADVGDDLGHFTTVIVPNGEGWLVGWPDYLDEDATWAFVTATLDADGSVGEGWSTPLPSVMHHAWRDGDALGWSTTRAIERRSTTTGEPLDRRWLAAESETIVSASPTSTGAVAMTMTGEYLDPGLTTMQLVVLDDALVPVGDPIVITDVAQRLDFDVAALDDATVASWCAEDGTLVLSRVVCG